MDGGSFSIAYLSPRSDHAWRLAVLIALSVALHVLVFWRLPYISDDRQYPTYDVPFDVILEPPAPKPSLSKPGAKPRGGEQTPQRRPRLPFDFGLDDPLAPVKPRVQAPKAAPPFLQHGGSASGDRFETSHGTVETFRVAGKDAIVRYTFRDGSVRCFHLREADPNSSFDSGSVMVGRRC